MEKWPEILRFAQNDNCGTGFVRSTTATPESSGKTNLGFLMRVLHALFIALLTAFGGCILAVFNG